MESKFCLDNLFLEGFDYSVWLQKKKNQVIKKNRLIQKNL